MEIGVWSRAKVLLKSDQLLFTMNSMANIDDVLPDQSRCFTYLENYLVISTDNPRRVYPVYEGIYNCGALNSLMTPEEIDYIAQFPNGNRSLGQARRDLPVLQFGANESEEILIKKGDYLDFGESSEVEL